MRNPAADQAGGTRATKTTPCCSKVGIKRGPWTAEEDEILARYIKREGEGAWRTLPKRAGLLRCGKSCRLRWMNYLRPHLNRGPITPDEEDLILRLHRLLGNRWSLIAGRIPGRTDNEIKNFWNTHLSKKLISQGLDPRNHKPLENYNPNPKHISSVSFRNNNSNNKDDNHRENYVRSSTLVEDSGLQATPNPNPNLDATSSTRGMPCPPEPFNQENDGMIMSGYNEEMYFSSFLDSLIVSDECVFPEPDHATNNNNDNDNDNSNNHMFQDQSMMMMMQPMGYEAKISHGFVWGSGHEISPLMDLEFSGYQRDQANENLDLADMHKQ